MSTLIESNGRTTPNRAQRRGYARQVKKLRLTFAGHLDGLEVVMTGLPIGSVLEIAELAGDGDLSFTPEGVRDAQRLFEILADHLVSWNLEDHICVAHRQTDCEICGPEVEREIVPVAANLEGIRTMDTGDVMLLIQSWTQNAAAVPGGAAGPLGSGSPAGDPSAVARLPMDPLLPSPPS